MKPTFHRNSYPTARTSAKGCLALLTCFLCSPAFADPAEIVSARIEGGTVSVTLRHGDTGWEDYADGWRVELDDGTVLGTRVLYHPHVEEQPFTRSLSGVEVPDGTASIFIRARTLPEGWGKDRLELPLN